MTLRRSADQPADSRYTSLRCHHSHQSQWASSILRSRSWLTSACTNISPAAAIGRGAKTRQRQPNAFVRSLGSSPLCRAVSLLLLCGAAVGCGADCCHLAADARVPSRPLHCTAAAAVRRIAAAAAAVEFFCIASLACRSAKARGSYLRVHFKVCERAYRRTGDRANARAGGRWRQLSARSQRIARPSRPARGIPPVEFCTGAGCTPLRQCLRVHLADADWVCWCVRGCCCR